MQHIWRSIFTSVTLFGMIFGLLSCAHSAPIGKFKVSSVKLSSTKNKSIAVIISDPDVRDSYDNGKSFTYNGVIQQLKSSFIKKLKPNFKKVVFLDADNAKADAEYFLKVSFEIKDVSSDTKNKCAADFRVEALAPDRKTRLAFKEDSGIKHKQGYEHAMMAPISVILDPALGLHTPEWLWLSTGVRSVDHALETLGSFESNDFCDGMAECALRLLAEGMPRVKANPHDLEARLKCQIGVWQSMIPIIGGTPMGASHAIGHILGGTCDVPHGYCSCVMAPYVLAFNEPVNGDRQKRISAAFGQPGKRASDVVDAFIRGLGMPRRLSEVGVGEDRLQQVAEYTMMDLWARTNPRTIAGPDDVMQILRLAA